MARSVEEFREPDGQRRCKLIERLQRGVPNPHLDAGDIAAVQASVLCETLLRPLLGQSQFSDSATQGGRDRLPAATARHVTMFRDPISICSRLIVTIDLS